MALLCVASPAYAGVGPGQPCAHGGNSTSSACLNGQNGDVYYGGRDNFNDNNMTTSASDIAFGHHANNEMWVYTRSDERQWVEVGIRQGYYPTSPGSCLYGGVYYPCAYARFWADFDSSGIEYRHTITFTSPTGANHIPMSLREIAPTTTSGTFS
jgi:hypothetical protein